jgi:hypothetical protein
MSDSNDSEKFENMLHSADVMAYGLIGTDKRPLLEIVQSDMDELTKLGVTIGKLVERMKEITRKAIPSLGNWTKIDDTHQAKIFEVKGNVPCPWQHPSGFAKRITYVENTATQTSVKWTDLNIHLIEQHNFFEGKGSVYRVEPKEVIKAIF